jgi:dihydroxy-acid dehydratase
VSEPKTSYWKSLTVELRAAGFDPTQVASGGPVVTVANPYTNAHRCNNRVQTIADAVVAEIEARGGKGLLVGTPAVSDALTQGSANAGYSLLSRELFADCIETGHFAHHGEAMLIISGCDKTGAAAMLPLARTNAPGLVIYPGTSSPGCVSFEPFAAKGNNLTILDYVEGRAANEAGLITDPQMEELERSVLPGSGTCGAMFTANTMSTIAEAIGMMLPRGASHPADYDSASDIHDDVKLQIVASMDALHHLIATDLRPRDILTREAFENAITTAYAMGGSTNLYLHILALAREAQIDLTIEQIHDLGARVPLITNLQPHGPYAMVSLHQLGGVPIVMKELLESGLLHGDAMTVTGNSVAQNLAAVPRLSDLGNQDVVHPVARPLANPGNHISVLKGNLAPESCVLKLGGKTLDDGQFKGRARVFENEPDAMRAIRANEIVAGDVIVVRYVGPVGAPGMPEMVMLTVQLQGRGLGTNVALITDGRFSGVSHGILIGHISPEAARGGPIGAVHEGDTIVIDPVARTLNLKVSPETLAARMASLEPAPANPTVKRGSVRDKYAKLVSSAHYGCVMG